MFSFTWEQREFKQTFDLLTNNTLSRAELNNEKGSVRNIHYGDILVKFGEIIDLREDDLPYITDEINSSKTDFLQDGDIIIADTAEDSTVGKCAEVMGISDADVVAGLHTIPCRPRKRYAQGYLGYFMNSSAYHDQLLPLMQGTKVTSVSKSALQETILCFPTDIKEQALIGAYFMRLEDLITLHQRDKSSRTALGSVERKEKANAWEQRKVADIALDTRGGGTPATSNTAYWNGEIPWIQSSDLSDGKLFGVKPRRYISTVGLNNSAAQFVRENSIAVVTRVGVGKLAFMPYSYTTSQDFLSLCRLQTEPYFTVFSLYRMLQGELQAVQGTSIKGMTKDDLLCKSISTPKDKEEQRQIGAFFKSLDNLITLHQRECKYQITEDKNVKQNQRDRPLLRLLRSVDWGV